MMIGVKSNLMLFWLLEDESIEMRESMMPNNNLSGMKSDESEIDDKTMTMIKRSLMDEQLKGFRDQSKTEEKEEGRKKKECDQERQGKREKNRKMRNWKQVTSSDMTTVIFDFDAWCPNLHWLFNEKILMIGNNWQFDNHLTVETSNVTKLGNNSLTCGCEQLTRNEIDKTDDTIDNWTHGGRWIYDN